MGTPFAQRLGLNPNWWKFFCITHLGFPDSWIPYSWIPGFSREKVTFPPNRWRCCVTWAHPVQQDVLLEMILRHPLGSEIPDSGDETFPQPILLWCWKCWNTNPTIKTRADLSLVRLKTKLLFLWWQIVLGYSAWLLCSTLLGYYLCSNSLMAWSQRKVQVTPLQVREEPASSKIYVSTHCEKKLGKSSVKHCQRHNGPRNWLISKTTGGTTWISSKFYHH